MSENLEIARQWLSKATNDLLNADNNLKSDVVPFDTVCFHCQQAAEKLLKAYLVGNGKPFPFSLKTYVTTRIFHLEKGILHICGKVVEVYARSLRLSI